MLTSSKHFGKHNLFIPPEINEGKLRMVFFNCLSHYRVKQKQIRGSLRDRLVKETAHWCLETIGTTEKLTRNNCHQFSYDFIT